MIIMISLRISEVDDKAKLCELDPSMDYGGYARFYFFPALKAKLTYTYSIEEDINTIQMDLNKVKEDKIGLEKRLNFINDNSAAASRAMDGKILYFPYGNPLTARILPELKNKIPAGVDLDSIEAKTAESDKSYVVATR